MIERNKITISFLPTDKELWDFIQHKKEMCNMSEYIRGLILQDMTPQTTLYSEDKIIEKLLYELRNNNIIANESFNITNEETKNTILNLF